MWTCETRIAHFYSFYAPKHSFPRKIIRVLFNHTLKLPLCSWFAQLACTAQYYTVRPNMCDAVYMYNALTKKQTNLSLWRLILRRSEVRKQPRKSWKSRKTNENIHEMKGTWRYRISARQREFKLSWHNVHKGAATKEVPPRPPWLLCYICLSPPHFATVADLPMILLKAEQDTRLHETATLILTECIHRARTNALDVEIGDAATRRYPFSRVVW